MISALNRSNVVATIGTVEEITFGGSTMGVAPTQVVRARIDSDTKDRAVEAFADMGLTLSEGIRLFLFRVASEKRLPFEVRVPNADTREAMAELASGGGKTFDTLDELMTDLHAED